MTSWDGHAKHVVLGFMYIPAQVGPNAFSRKFRNNSVQALVLIHLVVYHTAQQYWIE
jgi:hypothetical protein